MREIVGRFYWQTMHDSGCCRGFGYVPSRSLEVWLKAAARRRGIGQQIPYKEKGKA